MDNVEKADLVVRSRLHILKATNLADQKIIAIDDETTLCSERVTLLDIHRELTKAEMC